MGKIQDLESIEDMVDHLHAAEIVYELLQFREHYPATNLPQAVDICTKKIEKKHAGNKANN